MSLLCGVCFLIFLILAFVPDLNIYIMGALLTIIFSFFFVVVTSRLTGEIGSSANPVSGMTLTSLIFIALALLWWHGANPELAKIAALSCAVVVCVAVSLGGEIAQDLKTGFLVGGTPKKQQIGEVIGAITGAAVVVLTLYLMKDSYGISGDPTLSEAKRATALEAPQANVMAAVIKGIFENNFCWDLFITGCVIGLVVSCFRISTLAFAVGMYLKISTSLPIMVGGLIYYIVKKKSSKEDIFKQRNDRGVLYASGLLAGEALMGVVLAILMVIPFRDGYLYQAVDISSILKFSFADSWVGVFLTIAICSLLILSLFDMIYRKEQTQTPDKGE